MSVRHGVWLGVDVGMVRVGVARCDPDGILAVPEVTLARDLEHRSDLRALVDLVQEHGATGVVVGLPITLAGRHGPAADDATGYAQALRELIDPLPVELIDERLTTVSAEQVLRGRGIKGKARRAVVDQAAAVVILEHWLAQRRPGTRGPL
ncbi:MAG: Holliday junction resolvase RuvX [Pseudonocardiales bacterium]|nr:Holliday junction resolvase RuvX [Pseudonocardiales bacterium]